MRCEVVAVGTELLLGQIVDTNSAWIGEALALSGIDCLFQVKVGDNQARIAAAIRDALGRADAVVVCGGLGPTQDDITREAIAEVLGVGLERDEAMVEAIRGFFGSRGREMSANNARQADRPAGASFILQTRGTAPGLICPLDGPSGRQVIYAVPGVPYEMTDMMERAVLPDLRARAGTRSVIASRTLRTWGLAESSLAELIAARVDAQTNPTIAFLASGIEGIKVRLTAKADDPDAAGALLDAEEAELRSILGDLVFGVDDESMEQAVGRLLSRAGWTLGVAESVTAGLIASRVAEVPGSSEWFRGGVVSYASEVKFEVLGVPRGPVVTEACAAAMAEGVRGVVGSDVGVGVTGVAGPAEQDGQPVGTVFWGIALPGGLKTVVGGTRLPGDRARIRQFSAITVLDQLRRLLLSFEAA
ncbi:MAG: competence/damage-inducible protein A [Acidimicrobiales bacterium]